MRSLRSSLEPFARCQVVSMNFWSQLYLLLSTLSRSTSWPACNQGWEMGVELDEHWQGRRDLHATVYSSFLSVSLLHDRGQLAALLSISALLHSRSGLSPRPDNSRTKTRIDALRAYTTLSSNRTEVTGLEAYVWVNLRHVLSAINKMQSQFYVFWSFQTNFPISLSEKKLVILVYIRD